MPITDYPLAIPQGSRILISGANGFIASHIIKQFLEAGYKVPYPPPISHNSTTKTLTRSAAQSATSKPPPGSSPSSTRATAQILSSSSKSPVRKIQVRGQRLPSKLVFYLMLCRELLLRYKFAIL